MATVVYNEAKYLLSLGELNLLTDTLKAMLVTDEYVVDPNHGYVSDGTLVSPDQFEVDGTGYILGHGGSGRRTITNKIVEKDTGTSRVRLYGDDLSWNPINVGLIGGVILIREGTNNDNASLLIGYTNEGGFPIFTDGGEFQLRWHENGILAF